MPFPSNPVIGQRHLADNGQDFVWTAKGGWRSLSPSGSRVKQITYATSATPPVNPDLGDQWYDTVERRLKTWSSNGEFAFWRAVATTPEAVDTNDVVLTAERTMPLMWDYGEQNFAFEAWSNEAQYSWRDVDPIPVKRVTRGDDTLELETTVGLAAGRRYALVSATNTTLATVDVVSVLSPTVVRARVDLGINLVAADGATLSRTSFDVRAGYALVGNGDVLYTEPLSILQRNFKGRLRIRRSAEGTGIFTVQARTPFTSAWLPVVLLETTTPAVGLRDEVYAITQTGPLEFSFSFVDTGARLERIEHMMLYPAPQAVDARRVEVPANVTPVDQEINVSTTPTLTANTFRSLYNLEQNGAEFQVATDEAFVNLVVNSSSDFLASWIATTAPGTINDVVFTAGINLVAVGAGGRVVRSVDGGKTLIAVTPAGGVTTALNGVDADGLNTVVLCGDSGVLQTSTDGGASFATITPAGGYTGGFNGVALAGGYGVVVGATGEIQRTVNNRGGVYAKAPADNGYNGTLYEAALLANGRGIVVGAGGEIQTTSDYGATWRKRTQAAAYTGTWIGVHLQADGHAIVVGSGAEIQTSDDFGATWTRRVAGSNYAGTWNHVKVFGRYAIAVGSGGEIQTSDNYGATWSKRITPGASTAALQTVAFTAAGDNAILMGANVAFKPLKLEGVVNSYTVPSGENLLEISKVYWWRARYQDAAGFWSEYSKPTVFATKATLNAVNAPSNLAPAKDATNISSVPTLQGSAFTVIGDPDTHNGSQWQISTGATFGAVTYDSGTVAATTSHTLPTGSALQDSQVYTWRVRYRGTNNGWGPWSTPTSFVAVAKATTPSVIGVTENASRMLTLTHSAFSSVVPGDAFAQSTLEIATSATFETASMVRATTYAAGGTTINVQPEPVTGDTVYRKTINPDTTYYFRLAHKGTQSVRSDFSPVFSYRTRELPKVGEVVYTSAGSYDFVVPEGITSICAVVVGSGAGGAGSGTSQSALVTGGGGGGLTWKNNIAVTPGQTIRVTVGRGGRGVQTTDGPSVARLVAGASSNLGSIISATGGGQDTPGLGGSKYGGDGGGNGGGTSNYSGGGAGGYTGPGGNGGGHSGGRGSAGLGGGGGGGGGGVFNRSNGGMGGGGGVGLYGLGSNGAGAPPDYYPGLGGGGGSGGQPGNSGGNGDGRGGDGGRCGGGGGGGTIYNGGGNGGDGGVRIIWGPDRSFPSNAA